MDRPSHARIAVVSCTLCKRYAVRVHDLCNMCLFVTAPSPGAVYVDLYTQIKQRAATHYQASLGT